MHKHSVETEDSNWKSLYTLGGVATLLQLAVICVMVIVAVALGPRAESVQEYFTILEADKLAGILRSDFSSLVMIFLYLGTFPGLTIALRRVNPAYTALAALLTFIAVALAGATNSVFAMLHLSDQLAAATTEAQRAQVLAAGQAVFASDMWNSSGGYMAGMLLQGSGVIISMIMLRSKDFNKITAFAGLLGNAFDLAQHLIHPFAPAISEVILRATGPFYLVWFVMLARDFFRLRRGADLRKRSSHLGDVAIRNSGDMELKNHA